MVNSHLGDFIEREFKKSGRALDLGAGDFTDVNYLNHKGWYCEGVDKTTGADLENLYISENGPFDLVFSNYLLQELKNRGQLIRTAYNNLKDRGSLFLQTFDSSDCISKSGVSESWLKGELLSVGFIDIETRVFDFYDEDKGHNHWHRILQATAKK